MMLSTGYKKDDIVCFKLVNGDEIVAKIVESNSTHGWILQRPCTIIPSPQGLGLMQSLFAADINKNVELKSEHVMMHATVIKQLEDHYLQTITGIQTVSKGPIIV
jgi:hypothetical protein